MSAPERRTFGLRRDINELVRDEHGAISGAKIGRYAAQIIAGHLLETWIDPSWDILAVLFLVLIAPEAYTRVLTMWRGQLSAGKETTTTDTHEKTTKEVVTKPVKVDNPDDKR